MGAVVKKRMEPVPHRLLTACLFLACVLGMCYTCWASCTRFYPAPAAAAALIVWKSEVECARECP